MKLKHYKSATKDFIVNMKREIWEELSKMEREGTQFSAVVDEWTSNRNMQV
jgi:predicted CopG family antitoxin